MSEENKETETITKDAITKDMSLGEAAQKYPETAEVFAKYGLHCIGCPMATMETIEEGALGHGIGLEGLLADLNQAVENNSGLGKEAAETTSEPSE